LTKLPKSTSLADFTHFEPLIVQMSQVFFSRRAYGKRHYKRSHRGYILLICGEFPSDQIQLKLAYV